MRPPALMKEAEAEQITEIGVAPPCTMAVRKTGANGGLGWLLSFPQGVAARADACHCGCLLCSARRSYDFLTPSFSTIAQSLLIEPCAAARIRADGSRWQEMAGPCCFVWDLLPMKRSGSDQVAPLH